MQAEHNFRILLFVDSKWRDLPGVSLLRGEMQQRGAEVFVSTFHMWREAVELFAPHVVVLNHIQGSRNKMIASYVRRHGGLVVVLFNEGIIEFENKRKIFAQQREADNVDLFLCWNEDTANLVGGQVVGCPRFDVYNLENDFLIDSRQMVAQKHGIDTSKFVILFSESWPSAKFTYSYQAFHRMDFVDLGNTEVAEYNDPDAFALSQQKAADKAKLGLLVLKDRYPEFEIVIKTHPMSDYGKWAQWGQENDIKVVHLEYIFNLLPVADVLIGKLGSITVAEAWLSGVPAIKLESGLSASSDEQREADIYNADDIASISLPWPYDREAAVSEGFLENQRAYLLKWGLLAPKRSATFEAANLIEELLRARMPVSTDEPDYPRLAAARSSFDLEVALNPVDGFGNWGKSITAKDVYEWGRKLNGH